MMRQVRQRAASWCAPSFALVATLIAVPAHAQDAEGQVGAAGGDIIVTATRRSEPLQRVPIAVSVLDGDTLRRANLNNVRDIATQIPSLNFRTSASSKDQAIFVRGLGTVSTSPGVEPSVSTVLDGVVLARQGQATLDLLDIERIEVLRGPQGTLFGKNASAGVLNIVTRKPGDELRGSIDVGFFEGGEWRGRASISGPLAAGKLSASIAVLAATYDGNVKNRFDGSTVNGYDRYGTRGKLRFTPTDDVELIVTADYLRSKDTTPHGVVTRSYLTAFPNNAVSTFPTFAAALRPVTTSEDGREINTNFATSARERNYGASVELNVALGGHTLTSITAWRRWNNTQRQDIDRLPLPIIGVPQQADIGTLRFRQISQEVRLASPEGEALDYVVGAFYFDGRDRETYQRQTTVVTATTAQLTTGNANFGVVNENLAVFGEAGYKVTPDLRVFGGLRGIRDELSYDFNRVSTSAVAVPGIQTAFSAGGRTVSKDVAGRGGVQYQATPSIMAYATYSRGYKGPAFNPVFSMLPQDTQAVAPETSNAYEGGLKARTLNGALLVNVAVFLQKLQNFQAPFFDTLNGVPITRLVNAGRVSTRGAEVDLTIRAGRYLTLTGAGAYTDARIDEFICPAGTTASCNIDGYPLPFAPKWRISGRADWRSPIAGNLDLILGTDVNWRTSTQYSINQTPDTIEQGYAIWNATVGLGTQDGWRALFTVRNISDKSYSPFLSRIGQGVTRFVPRDDSRYVGLTVLKDF